MKDDQSLSALQPKCPFGQRVFLLSFIKPSPYPPDAPVRTLLHRLEAGGVAQGAEVNSDVIAQI